MAVKFPLKMADGAAVRTLEDLREHFDLTTVLSYYDNGRLVKWLENGYYDEEAGKVAALDAASADFAKELCAVLGVERPEADTGAVDLGSISSRNERLNRLKQYTADDTILAAVDRVAFTQKELNGLLKKGVKEVYLCGKKFIISGSTKRVIYIGVNKPQVGFGKDVAKAGIEIRNVNFDSDAVQSIGDTAYESGDYTEAVKWYSMAAEQGNMAAQTVLAKCYEQGEGVTKDLDIAIKWYSKASEQGDVAAKQALVRCQSSSVSKASTKVKTSSTRSERKSTSKVSAKPKQRAKTLSKEKMFELGEEAYGAADYGKAVEWYEKAANLGDLQSQVRLGFCYLWGHGVEQDVDVAEKWYELAAHRGSAEAQEGLAKCAIRRARLSLEATVKESQDILDMWNNLRG